MTTPVTPVTKPTKTWITTAGMVLAVVVPLVTSMLTYLPPEWAAVITGVIGVLTVLGVYTVPNKPTGEVVVVPSGGVSLQTFDVPEGDAGAAYARVEGRGGSGGKGSYTNPWR